jgi:hypothetical protein
MSGYPYLSIKMFYSFKSFKIIPLLCKYSKPKMIPAKTKRIFSSSDLINSAPLPVHYYVNDIKSPPCATGQK